MMEDGRLLDSIMRMVQWRNGEHEILSILFSISNLK